MLEAVFYILLGAASGYLTNRWAVKKIFRKYPLIGGAKIIKRRRRMSCQLAKSVEKDILEKRQLFDVLEQPQLKEILEKKAESFLKKLPEKAALQLPYSLADTPHFSLLKANFSAYVYEVLEESLPYFLKNRQLDTEQLFSATAQLSLATNITEFINSQIERQKTRERFLLCLQNNFAHRKLAQLLPLWVFKKLSTPAEELFSGIFPFLEQNSEQFIKITGQTLENVQFSKQLKHLCDQLFYQSPEQIYQNSNVDLKKVSEIFSQRLTALLYTQPELIAQLLNTLFTHLSQSKITLIELFPLTSQKRLEQYLETIFPKAIEQLMQWLQGKKGELEECVNSSIRKVLTEDRNVIEKLQNIVLNLFSDYLGNIAQHFNIVDLRKMTQELADPQNPIKAEISKKILRFLHEQPLGELFYKLQNFKIPQSFSQIIKRRFWQRKQTQQNKIENLLPNEVFAEELFKHFDNLVLLIENIMTKNLVIFSEKPLNQTFKNFDARRFSEQDEIDVAKKIYNTLGKPHNVQHFKRQFVQQKKRFSHLEIKNVLPHTLPPLKLPPHFTEKLLSRFTFEAAKLQKPLQRELLKSSQMVLKNLSKLPIEKFFEKNMQVKQYSVKLASLLHQELKTKTQNFLASGQLASIIKKRLDGLSEKQLAALLSNIFEKQLRTVNILGGVFGAIAGLALFYLPIAWGWQGFFYPLIGWLTNVFAVNYLFMYKYIKGTIAKNLSSFAKRMASFLDKDILNRQAFSSSIPWQKIRLQLMQKINLKSILQLFKQQTSQEKIINKLFNDKTQQQWAASLAQSSCSQLALPESSKLLESLKSVMRDNSDKAGEFFHNFLEQKKSWGQLLPEKEQERLKKLCVKHIATSIDNKCKELSNLQWFQILQLYGAESYLLLRDKIDNFYRSKDFVAKLSDFLLAPSRIQDISLLLQRRINDFLKINQEEKLASLFDGRLLAFILKEISNLTPQLSAWLINFLKNKRRELRSIALKFYENKTTWLQRWGGRLLGVEAKITQAVDQLLDVELPHFIYSSSQEIEENILNFIEHNAQQISIDQLIPLEHISLEKPVAELLNSEDFSKVFKHFITQLRNLLPLQETFLAPLALADIESLPSFLKEQFGAFLKKFSQNVFSEEQLIPLINFFWEKYFAAQQSATFFRNFNIEDWQQLCTQLLEKATNQSCINQFLELELEQLLHVFKEKKLDFFIPQELLQQTLQSFLQEIQDNHFLMQFLRHFLNTQLERLIQHCDVLIPLETRSMLSNFLSDTVVEHLQEHIEEVLQNIDVQGVAERTLTAMDVKTIKEIFYSFAADIFNSLKRDGLILGFPPVLLLALLVTSIDELKRKDVNR